MNRKERRAAAKTGKFLAAPPKARSADAGAIREAALREHAIGHYQAGRFREASEICQQLLALNRNDLVALHLVGLLALQAGRNEVAINVLGAAIKLNDKLSDLHSCVADALQRVGRFEEAIASYQRALALDPLYVDALYNCGNVLLKLRRYDEALAHYDRVVAIKPDFADAFNNRGNTWFELKHYQKALSDFDRALAIHPQFVGALGNRGTALVELQRYTEGIASFDRALAIDPGDITALANRGNALFELRRYAEATSDFDRLLAVDPDHAYAAGKALYCRLLDCDWTDYDRAAALIVNKVSAGRRAAIPFMFLNISDSVSAQRQCAQIFSRDKHPASIDTIWRGEPYEHEKIRVAYLSADFRHHPMAYLMVGLFETHDRKRFDTTAISFGPSSKDQFRERLENSFDRFLDVRTKSDHDVALLLRELEIDIAVDLMGYTHHCRPGILAYRPAPIQVNYLGFAGSMGTENIDYIIADRFVVPEDFQEFYTEQVVYLPDSYFPADSGRVVNAHHLITRAEAGLPEGQFVFCCFNQNCKITPPLFDVWMNLLRQIEGSVLWLVEDSAVAARNLRREAERRGVGADRLIFARRVKLDEYLARLHLADLFLDTHPFNAHTTASDALWAGLPVVTCPGLSFASRVAGSLLNAIGLPELITDNLESYAELTLKIAQDPKVFADIRSKLARNRKRSPLFDTERFCRHIEIAYQTMWQRYRCRELPAGFTIPT